MPVTLNVTLHGVGTFTPASASGTDAWAAVAQAQSDIQADLTTAITQIGTNTGSQAVAQVQVDLDALNATITDAQTSTNGGDVVLTISDNVTSANQVRDAVKALFDMINAGYAGGLEQ